VRQGNKAGQQGKEATHEASKLCNKAIRQRNEVKK